MSWEIFLGIPSMLVDFDDLFSWILHKNPRNLWVIYGYLRNFLGNSRIFSEIFLGSPGILVDLDDLFSWILHKNPRNLWETYGYLRYFLGNSRIFSIYCEIFLGIPAIWWILRICFLDIAQKSQEFVGNLWIFEKIPGKI